MSDTSVKDPPAKQSDQPLDSRALLAWSGRSWALLTFSALTLAAWVGLNEVDKVISAVQIGSASHSAASLFAPFVTGSDIQTAFQDWSIATPAVQQWLRLYIVIDAIFILGYVVLLTGAKFRWQVISGGWILALAIADIAEDALAFLSPLDQPLVLAWAIALASAAKWLVTLGVLGRILYGVFRKPDLKTVSRRLGIGLKMQRFSLIIVLLLAVLMIAPGQGVVDQASDIQRSWLITTSLFTGLTHFFMALVTFVVLAASMLMLSKLREAAAVDAYKSRADNAPDIRPPSKWWGWVLAVAVFIAVAALLAWSGLASVSWLSVLAVAAVPLSVVVLNGAVEFLNRGSTAERQDVQPGGPPDAPVTTEGDPARRVAINVDRHRAEPEVPPIVRDVGDLLAFAVVSLLGVGLVRAFTSTLLVMDSPLTSLVGIVSGLFIGIGSWLVALFWIKHRPSLPPHLGTNAAEIKQANRRIILAASLVLVAVLVPLLVWPAISGGFLGVLGVVGLGLCVLSVIFYILALLAQQYVPLPLFSALQLRATPMISLLLLTAFLVSQVDRSSDLHLIRLPTDQVKATASAQWNDPDNSFDSRVSRWLGNTLTAECAVAIKRDGVPVTIGDRPVSATPMLMVGAAGGGIRAAWWTVDVMSQFAHPDGLPSSPGVGDPDSGRNCGEHAVMAVSGASGGSVGLGLVLAAADPYRAVQQLADPGALADAADGLVVRDVLAGITGVNAVVAGAPDGDEYPDRAGLLEQSWESAVDELKQPFPAPPGSDAVPWATFLNSTSAQSGCRVVISNVNLQTGSDASTETTDCGLAKDGTGIPGSYNLYAAMPCLTGLNLSTAVLLSSRFPFVTPSGVARSSSAGRSCASPDADRTDQLIDGGYAENSGIGTLNDLSPNFMPLIREHNASQFAEGMTGDINLVVPVVVSIDSTPRAIQTGSRSSSAIPEFLVPVYGGLRMGATLSDTDSLIARTLDSTDDWLADPTLGCSNVQLTPPVSASCAERSAAQASVEATFSDRAILISPVQAPQVAAPLGWVLSDASRSSLDQALKQQVTCTNLVEHPECGFGNLLKLLRNPE